MQTTDYELYGNYLVTREVSFHGSLFEATTLTLELFNVIIKPWESWTINHSPCFKWGKLIQYVSKSLVKAVGEHQCCPSVRLHKT